MSGWIVGSEDGYRSGPHPTRKAAVASEGGGPVIRRKSVGDGEYAYTTGWPPYDTKSFYVYREGSAADKTIGRGTVP